MQTARRLVKGPDTAETSEKHLAQVYSYKFELENSTVNAKKKMTTRK